MHSRFGLVILAWFGSFGLVWKMKATLRALIPLKVGIASLELNIGTFPDSGQERTGDGNRDDMAFCSWRFGTHNYPKLPPATPQSTFKAEL